MDDLDQQAKDAQQRVIYYQTVTLPALLAEQQALLEAQHQAEQDQNSAG
jgi:hypothetical protein